jgi:hypothetical protein
MINFVDGERLQFYPNPASSWFEVVTDTRETNFSLFNAVGHNVTDKVTLSFFDNRIKVGLGSLPAGGYYLKVGARVAKIRVY